MASTTNFSDTIKQLEGLTNFDVQTDVKFTAPDTSFIIYTVLIFLMILIIVLAAANV